MVCDQILCVLHTGLLMVRQFVKYFDSGEDAATRCDENADILLVARSDDVKEAAWRMRTTIVRRRLSIGSVICSVAVTYVIRQEE